MIHIGWSVNRCAGFSCVNLVQVSTCNSSLPLQLNAEVSGTFRSHGIGEAR